MSAEVWQFVGVLAFFSVALFLWLRIVYLPGRTLERWEDQRIEAKEEYGRTGDSSSPGHDS